MIRAIRNWLAKRRKRKEAQRTAARLYGIAIAQTTLSNSAMRSD